MAELVIVGGGIDPAGCPSYSSYALLTDAGAYLLDCGEATVGRLKKLGIDPLSLRAIFITHMHYDHMAGLFGLLYGIWAACRRSDEVPDAIREWSTAQGLAEEDLPPALSLYLPPEGIEPIEAFLPAVYLAREIWRTELKILPVGCGPFHEDGTLQVAAQPTGHLQSQFNLHDLPRLYPGINLEAYSFMLEVAGTRLVYSGDLALAGRAAIEEFRPAAEWADVLMTEVAHVLPEEYLPVLAALPARQIILVHVHANLMDRVRAWLRDNPDPRFVLAENGMRIGL